VIFTDGFPLEVGEVLRYEIDSDSAVEVGQFVRITVEGTEDRWQGRVIDVERGEERLAVYVEVLWNCGKPAETGGVSG
jgi:hypothetical protein